MGEVFAIETGRLVVRHFCSGDFEALKAIMGKPEVMYAWEHGFTDDETREWLERQIARYRDDGYGYFAVVLKETGKLIGQAGLINAEVDGKPAVEIGYVFDDAVWGNGYALEAASACVELAFRRFGIAELYATIRPENAASVNLARKLGMKKTGAYAKVYQGKKMPHDIYLLHASAWQPL